MKNWLVLWLLCIGLCRIMPAAAAAVEFADFLDREQIIGDDVYMFGENITVKGKVIGDLLAIGKSVSCDGAVAADLLCAGLQVEAAGSINDDIRALALTTADLSGHVGDDAVLAGFRVNIAQDSRIGHGAMVLAGQTAINGHIRGDVTVTGYDCTLGGDVLGNVTASTVKLQLTPTARIRGNLIYTSEDAVNIPPGAVVEGEIIHQKSPAPSALLPVMQREQRRWLSLLAMATWDAGLIIVGTCMLLLLPQTIHAPKDAMTNRPWLACMYGFFWLIGAPVTASLGIITVVGLPLSIALAFLYISSLYLSSLPVALWLGQKLFRSRHKPCLSLVIGVLVISLLRSLPYIGFIIGTIVLTVGLGALALSFRDFIRSC